MEEQSGWVKVHYQRTKSYPGSAVSGRKRIIPQSVTSIFPIICKVTSRKVRGSVLQILLLL